MAQDNQSQKQVGTPEQISSAQETQPNVSKRDQLSDRKKNHITLDPRENKFNK